MLRRSLLFATVATTITAKRPIVYGSTTHLIRHFIGGSCGPIYVDLSTKKIDFGEDIKTCKEIHESRKIKDQALALIQALIGNNKFRLEQDEYSGHQKIIFQNIPENEKEEFLLKCCSILSSKGIKGKLFMSPISQEPRIDLHHSRQDLLKILTGDTAVLELPVEPEAEKNNTTTIRLNRR